MSDDLLDILQSIQSTQRNLLKRIETLESQQGVAKARDWGTPFTGFGYCTPTSPPSTSVIVKQGWVWCYAFYNNQVSQVAPRTWREQMVDLAPHADAFDNAYYYRWGILAQNLRTGAFDIWQYSSGTWPDEWENAEAATRSFYGQLSACNIDLTDLWGNPLVFPHAVFLLRNNGTTGAPGEIEPVTLHDRSQSSFLLWDARPWMNLVCSYVC